MIHVFVYTGPCLASSIGPWVMCLYWVSDTNKDIIPLVSSCTRRWPRRAARQASCCFSSNRLPAPSFLSLPFLSLSATTLSLSVLLAGGPAKPQGLPCSLKACSHTHLSTSCCPSCPHLPSALLPSGCSLSLVDSLHFGDLPPRLPWEPTTLIWALAPAPPQHTTDSSMSQGNPRPLYLSLSLCPSICPCPSLTHFPPSSSSFISFSVFTVQRCFLFPQFVSCTQSLPYLSLSLSSLCGILQNVKATQPERDMSKDRHMLCTLQHTAHKYAQEENKTLTTWSWKPSSW